MVVGMVAPPQLTAAAWQRASKRRWHLSSTRIQAAVASSVGEIAADRAALFGSNVTLVRLMRQAKVCQQQAVVCAFIWIFIDQQSRQAAPTRGYFRRASTDTIAKNWWFIKRNL